MLQAVPTNRVKTLDELFPNMRDTLGLVGDVSPIDVVDPEQRSINIVADLCVECRDLLEFVDPEYLDRVVSALVPRGVEVDNVETVEEVDQDILVETILWAIRKKFAHIPNHTLPGHLNAVGSLSQALGKEVRLGHVGQKTLYRAGATHDLGKVDPVVNYIVEKPRKLTTDEKDPTGIHAELTALSLKIVRAETALQIVGRGHHERINGEGYPSQLSGRGVDNYTRVVTVADLVDAMTDKRPGRIPKTLAETISELRRWQMDRALDDDVVNAFLRMCDRSGLKEGSSASNSHLRTSGLLRRHANMAT